MSDQKPLVTSPDRPTHLRCVPDLVRGAARWWSPDGSYKVRGTVRSTSNEQKLAPLKVAAVPRIVCAMSCADTTSVPLPGGLRGPVFAAGAG
eukprot:579336-Rhodomonas_salina.2